MNLTRNLNSRTIKDLLCLQKGSLKTLTIAVSVIVSVSAYRLLIGTMIAPT